MSGSLLLISIGPVQDFIAQARRTRDLWFGSHLLSELSRAVVRALVEGEGKAESIFPALAAGDAELERATGPLRDAGPNEGKAPLNVCNRILVEVPAGGDPAELAKTARKAAQDELDWFAKRAEQKCAGLLAGGYEPVWLEQLATCLEFNAAWTELADGPNGYVEARLRLDQRLAGRKNLRDFVAWQAWREGAPKSSLDGARDSVLADPPEPPPKPVRRCRDLSLSRKYRIAPGEQLDAIGLLKRAGGEPDQFVPLMNVALSAWLDALWARPQAGALRRAFETACQEAHVGGIRRPDKPMVAGFGYDAQVFLPERWPALFDEQAATAEQRQAVEGQVRSLREGMPEPFPCVACLVADGDHMGKALAPIATPDDHRRFSCELSRFAAAAREAVEQHHRGVLVYSGGDDVLAFVCLTDVLSCAKELAARFHEAMTRAFPTPPNDGLPTLSVGIGIAYALESMADILRLGQAAEKAAKHPDRNGLALVVDKRSGGQVEWRTRWGDWGNDPVGRLTTDVALLRGRLPSTKVHEIARDLDRLPLPRDVPATEAADWGRLVRADVARTLARSRGSDSGQRPPGDPPTPSEVGLCFADEPAYEADLETAKRWVRRMLVADALSRASRAVPEVQP